MNALFFFGTLIDPDLFRLIVGRPMADFAVKPATLAGYRITRAAAFPYPMVKADPRSEAPGLRVAGLTATEVERISYYETDEYDLFGVTLKIAPNQFESAKTFIATAQLEASDEPWSLVEWEKEVKELALIEAALAMDQFGVLTRETVNDHWPDFEIKAAQILRERQRAPAALS